MSKTMTHSRAWPEVELGRICEFAYGKSLPAKTRSGAGFPVYGSNGPVGLHDEALTNSETIIIGRKGSFGEVHYCSGACFPIDTTYYITDAQTDVHLPWLARRLGRLGLNQLNRAAAIPGLNRSDAYRLRLLLPSLAEQKRIAAILDTADALRAKRRESLVELDTLLQSTFLNMFGDPVTNPMNHPKKTLKIAFEFTTGKLDSNAAVEGGKYPFFTCARETFTIDDYAFDCEALLLAGNNANADYSVKHYKGRFNAYQRTYVINVDENQLTYTYSRLALEYLLSDLKHFSKGTNTKYLTMVILNRMSILVPPLEHQRRFTTIVESIEHQKARMHAHLAELDTLFASLQHRSFNGEL